jgi:hypothetical protein
VVELGDTIFLVLRKRKLTFLHVYHHCTVLLYVAFAAPNNSTIIGIFTSMNFFVHALMYTYFALKSMHVYIPRNIAMLITSVQISQMILGTYFTLAVVHFVQRKIPCSARLIDLKLAGFMYASYAVLFLNYFIRSYFFPYRKPNIVPVTNGKEKKVN